MIDFYKEKEPFPDDYMDKEEVEDAKENNATKLARNLQMQKDLEIEIERCAEIKDFENLEKTRKTLEILKLEEAEIRKKAAG